MTIRTHRVLAVLGVAALALPNAAAAAPGHGKGHGKAISKAKAEVRAKTAKPVTYIVKGVYDAADGTVTVTGGNSHTRRGGLLGERVAFDFSSAKVVVADVDADGKRTSADLRTGDRLQVQVRLPRREPGAGPHVARKVIDKTNPPVEDAAQEDTEIGAGASAG